MACVLSEWHVPLPPPTYTLHVSNWISERFFKLPESLLLYYVATLCLLHYVDTKVILQISLF